MIFAALFVIFCGVCSLLAFTRHPIYGLYFYLAATFVFPPGRWWGYIFGGMRWSLLAAAITGLAIMLHRGKLSPKPLWLSNVPALGITIYASWMWIQTFWALDSTDHLNGTIQFSKYALAFWFVYRIVDSKELLQSFLTAHVLGCTLLGIFAFAVGRSGDRLDGVGGPGIDDANTLGMYFSTGAMVGLGLLLTYAGWRRWLIVACMAFVMNGLVLTNTRGALLGLLAGGLVVAAFKSREHRKLFWVLALVGALGLVSIIDKSFIERMWTIREAATGSEETDASAQSRTVLAKVQLRMFLEYPMGAGHRGTGVLSPRYLDERWLAYDPNGEGARTSHNTFLTTLVEQGVPGALIFIWVVVWTLVTIVRLRGTEKRHGDADLTTLTSGIGGALAAIFVAGNTADFLLAEVQFWLFASLVSIVHFAAAGNVRGPDATTAPVLLTSRV